LCTGYGGLDLAVGGDLVFCSEIDPAANVVLAQRFPDGWVTDCDLPRTVQLRILGNGVVPQQAAHAWQALTGGKHETT
jgi:site-specific DNA-cytosine methylase